MGRIPIDPKQLSDSATFICGHPKSGTSLLASLFDSHTQLIVYPEETLFFRMLLPQILGLPEQKRIQDAKEWMLRIFYWDPNHPHPTQQDFPDRDYSAVGYDAVSQAFDELVCSSASATVDLLPCAVMAYGKASQNHTDKTVRWVEKSPYNEEYSNLIFSAWPDAKCIHIIRDPRDNYASYVRKHPDWTPEVFAYSWLRSTRTGIKNLRTYGPKRYKIINYETLVKQPEETLRDLSMFLGIEIDDTMLTPTRAGKIWQGNSMFGDRFNGISESSVGRFRENLAPEVIRRLEKLLYPELEHFNYVLDSPMGWFDKILSFSTRTYWYFRNMYASSKLGFEDT